MPADLAKSLRADQSVLLLVDYQPRMVYGVEGVDRTMMQNNVLALAKTASILGIPAVLTSIGERLNGPFTPEIVELFPGVHVIERRVPGFDALADETVLQSLRATGRRQVVMTGLWTSMCFSFTALHALRDGYEVFGVMDAAGSESAEAHERSIVRMVQAGVVPCTWFQTAAEWMDTWENPKADELRERVYKVHNGFFGQTPATQAPRTERGIAAGRRS
jgi:nicotinamidase-related amidase